MTGVQTCALPISVVEHGEQSACGYAYYAADNSHYKVLAHDIAYYACAGAAVGAPDTNHIVIASGENSSVSSFANPNIIP